MQHAHFDTPLELKFVADTGLFEGYASVFHVTDSVRDRIAPGAFKDSLAAHQKDGRLPPMLWQHDSKQPIGAWRAMYEDAHGLYVEGALFIDDIPRAREAYRLMKENVVTGLSIGYRAKKSHRDEKSGDRVLTEIELLEVSMVTFPANDYARIARVKSIFDAGRLPSEREFEAFLREAGLSRKQAKGLIAQGYKSLNDKSPNNDPRDAEMTPDDDLLLELAATIRRLT